MRSALVSVTVCLGSVAAVADARPATVSDFAICNGEATDVAGGSALPGGTERAPRMAPPPSAPPDLRASKPSPVAPAPGAGGSTGMASGTDSSGKIVAGSRDVLLEGMAADRAADAAYQAAYRECMTRRGVTARPSP